eukprot:jgi/Botrbrau1/582/Bobra.0010s0048.1
MVLREEFYSLQGRGLLDASFGADMGLPEQATSLQGLLSINPLAIVFAALLYLVHMGLSLWLSLGLQRTIAVALFRCLVQLGLVSLVLTPVLQVDRWWITCLVAGAMIAIAAAEATSHPQIAYEGMYLHVLGALGGAAGTVLLYGLVLVLQPRHFWSAQYLIPTLAVILGGTISSISSAISSVAEDLTSGRGNVELLLGLGASRMEATRGVVQRAVIVACLPTFQQMSVLAVASVPSFMSGEVISGMGPPQAAVYQAVMMVLISVTTMVASTAAVFLAVQATIDRQHCFGYKRWRRRVPADPGLEAWLHSNLVKAFMAARGAAWRAATRLQITYGWSPGPGGARQPSSASRRRRLRSYFAGTRIGRTILSRFNRPEYEDDEGLSSNLQEVIHSGGLSDDESVFSGTLSDDGRDGLLGYEPHASNGMA